MAYRCPEQAHLARAVAALGDEYADERRVLEEILKNDNDVSARREAGHRYLEMAEARKDEEA